MRLFTIIYILFLTLNTANADVIQSSKKYIGLHETKNQKQLTKILGFNPRSTPWCAGFINAILKQNNMQFNESLSSLSYIKYGKKVKKNDISKGDIVIFKRKSGGHIGFVYKHDEKFVYVLGGNQSNKVSIKKYRKSRIIAIRRPINTEPKTYKVKKQRKYPTDSTY